MDPYTSEPRDIPRDPYIGPQELCASRNTPLPPNGIVFFRNKLAANHSSSDCNYGRLE